MFISLSELISTFNATQNCSFRRKLPNHIVDAIKRIHKTQSKPNTSADSATKRVILTIAWTARKRQKLEAKNN